MEIIYPILALLLAQCDHEVRWNGVAGAMLPYLGPCTMTVDEPCVKCHEVIHFEWWSADPLPKKLEEGLANYSLIDQ